MLVEYLDCNFPFCWLVGLSVEDTVWSHSTHSKKHERIVSDDIPVLFLQYFTSQFEGEGILSEEHFTVDGTLTEAWGSQKVFVPQK